MYHLLICIPEDSAWLKCESSTLSTIFIFILIIEYITRVTLTLGAGNPIHLNAGRLLVPRWVGTSDDENYARNMAKQHQYTFKWRKSISVDSDGDDDGHFLVYFM